MSTPNNPDRNDGYSGESPAPASSDAERERMERRLAELQEQGIVSDSRGPRGPLLRFLDEQMRDHRESDQE